MTGPQHWREADLILTGGESCEYGCPHSGCPHEMSLLARARAHAALALAAAVIAAAYGHLSVPDDEAWQEVLAP